jgi:hypothetical protein
MPTDRTAETQDEEFELIFGCLSVLTDDCDITGFVFCSDFNSALGSIRSELICDLLSVHGATLHLQTDIAWSYSFTK